MRKALIFWMPLTLVRLVQTVSRPLINLFVSRTLSESAGENEAAKVCSSLCIVNFNSFRLIDYSVLISRSIWEVHHICHLRRQPEYTDLFTCSW